MREGERTTVGARRARGPIEGGSDLAWPLRFGCVLEDVESVRAGAGADAGMRDDQQGGDADDAEARLRVWIRTVVL